MDVYNGEKVFKSPLKESRNVKADIGAKSIHNKLNTSGSKYNKKDVNTKIKGSVKFQIGSGANDGGSDAAADVGSKANSVETDDGNPDKAPAPKPVNALHWFRNGLR